MKIQVQSESQPHISYTVEKTTDEWRCTCADYSAKTLLYKRKNYECFHIKKAICADERGLPGVPPGLANF